MSFFPILFFSFFLFLVQNTTQARTAHWRCWYLQSNPPYFSAEVMFDHTNSCEISCLWNRHLRIAVANDKCVVLFWGKKKLPIVCIRRIIPSIKSLETILMSAVSQFFKNKTWQWSSVWPALVRLARLYRWHPVRWCPQHAESPPSASVPMRRSSTSRWSDRILCVWVFSKTSQIGFWINKDKHVKLVRVWQGRNGSTCVLHQLKASSSSSSSLYFFF